MNSILTIRLREADARADRKQLGPCRLRDALDAALAAKGRKQERKAAARRPAELGRGSSKKTKGGGWPTKKLRVALWERSEGRCEACGDEMTWSGSEMDHFRGRGKAPQLPENTWLICSECHRRKHAGEPSRTWWLGWFLKFIRRRFPNSETVKVVEGQLEAERLIAKAEGIRARRGGQPATPAIFQADQGGEPHYSEPGGAAGPKVTNG